MTIIPSVLLDSIFSNGIFALSMLIGLADRMIQYSPCFLEVTAMLIGERFLHFLRDVPPRPMRRLHLFMNFARIKIESAIHRATHIIPNGNGVRLLTAIVKTADLPVLLSPEWTDDEKIDRLLRITKDLEKLIDPRLARHLPKRLFIHGRTPCFEMVIPTRRSHPASDIPFDLPYDDPAWQAIRPLRLCDMGACDFPMQLQGDMLSFKNNTPTHAVFALDCVALVAKFLAYYKTQPQDLDTSLLTFLHKEIVVPCLLYDGLSVWLRNVFRQQLLSQSKLEYHTSTVWDVVNIDTLGSDFNGALEDIHHLRRDLESGSISPQTALSSLTISTKGESFTKWYKDLYYTTQIPDQQPWLWVECLKNIQYFEFILSVSSFNTSYPDVISFQRDILRDVRFWNMTKPWQDVSFSVPYRTQVRSRLEGMQAYLSGG